MAGVCMPEGPKGLKALQVGCAHAARDPIQFRVVPLNRERYSRIEKNVVVERPVSVLPKIIGIDQQKFSDRLLQTAIELVAKSGLNRHAKRAEYALSQPSQSGCARK